jgi:hypothetical protein
MTKSKVLSDIAKFTWAHVGSKKNLGDILDLAVSPNDFPSGEWQIISKSSYRTGIVGRDDEISRRAKQLKLVTAVVEFGNEFDDRKLTINIQPLAKESDVGVRVASFVSRMSEIFQGRRDIVGFSELGGLPSQWQLKAAGVEYMKSGRNGSVSDYKSIAISCGSIYLTMKFKAKGSGWNIADALEIAQCQARKILMTSDNA